MPNTTTAVRMKRKRPSSSSANDGNPITAAAAATESAAPISRHGASSGRTSPPPVADGDGVVGENPFTAMLGCYSLHGDDVDDLRPDRRGDGDEVLDHVVAFMEYSRLSREEKLVRTEELKTAVRQLLLYLSQGRQHGPSSAVEQYTDRPPLDPLVVHSSVNNRSSISSTSAYAMINSSDKERRRWSQSETAGGATSSSSSSSPPSLATKTEVGRLLLPWAIKGIIHHDQHNHNHTRHRHHGAADVDEGKDGGSATAAPAALGDTRTLAVLYWTTLRACLEFFEPAAAAAGTGRAGRVGAAAASPSIPGSSSHQNVLTLSVMHRVVPVALRTALTKPPQGDDDDNNETAVGCKGGTNDAASAANAADADTTSSVPILARDCYCRLVRHFYRPPFDVLCDTLLPILAGDGGGCGGNGGDDDDHDDDTAASAAWHSVAGPTLLRTASSLTKANPKRSFQLLVRPRTLLVLARIHRRCEGGAAAGGGRIDTEDDNAGIEDDDPGAAPVLDGLTRLISEGLFSLEHHMNGYRSLKLTIATTIGGAEASGRRSNGIAPPTKEAPSPRGSDQHRDGGSVAATVAAVVPPTDRVSHFQCYQQGLLATLQACLSPSPDGDEVKFSSWEASQVAELVPLLLTIFLDQTSKMQQQRPDQHQHQKHHHQKHPKHSKQNKSEADLSYFQFSFFASVTGMLLSKLSESATPDARGNGGHVGGSDQQNDDCTMRISLLTSVGQNLEGLLEHNVYQPSAVGTKERTFLELIGRDTALRMAIISSSDESYATCSRSSAREWRKLLVILDALTRMNPTTLRKELPELLVGICTNGTNHTALESPPAIATEATTFLSTIISTYSKLRQLDYFYKSLIESVSTMLQNQDTARLRRLTAILDDPGIAMCLGRATQESPIQQLKLVVHRMNASILDISRGNVLSGSTVAQAAISLLTKALAGLLRNIRVDGNTSTDVLQMCKDVMKGPVLGLAGEMASDRSMTSPISAKISCILLCAWTINLTNRCQFWASDSVPEQLFSSEFEVPFSILQILEKASNDINHLAGVESDDDEFIEGMKFLACQRINNEISGLSKEQTIAFATNDQEYRFRDKMSEVRQLVRFVLREGQSDSDGKRTRNQVNWAVLVPTIPSWAPYAEPTDIDSFLTPLLHVLMDPDATFQERRDTLGILNDASFYEIPAMSRRIGTNVISVVAATIHTALQASADCSSEALDSISSMLDSRWAEISSKEPGRMFAESTSLNFTSELADQVLFRLNKSMLILDVVDGLRVPIWEECEEGIDVVELAFRAESICILIRARAVGALNIVAIRLVNSLRQVAARVLSGLTEDEFKEWAGRTNDRVVFLLADILKKTADMFEDVRIDDVLQQEVLLSCALLSGSILEKMSSDSTYSPEKFIQVLKTACTTDQGKLHDLQIVVYTSYACQLLKAYRPERDCPASHVNHNDVFRTVKQCFWRDAVEQFDQQGSSCMVQTQCSLFIADMLVASVAIEGELETLTSSIESKIINKMKTCVEQMGTKLDSELRPLAYLISILATVKPTAVRQIGLKLVSAGSNKCSLFTTPLCAVATGMETEELSRLFDHLTVHQSDECIDTKKLTIIRALILTLRDPAQVEVIRSFSSEIFHACLKLMAQAAIAHEIDDSSFRCASSLVMDLASRKEVFAFRERDIAVVLGHISAVMRTASAHISDCAVGARVDVFDASFSLLSCILQRFAKQAHACVPCVVITLNVMLEFSLDCPLPETSAMICGQKFSRLCELLLPYGEVYKKHILCLIVRFVDSLGRELESTRKKSLLPAMYCLLDMIQQHEIAQLNSMLDEMGRALLRSVHENYRKVHVYTGQ